MERENPNFGNGAVNAASPRGLSDIEVSFIFALAAVFLFCTAFNLLNPYNMVATLSGQNHEIFYSAVHHTGIVQICSVTGCIVSVILALFYLFLSVSKRIDGTL
jgi:hypothetical protein